MDKKHKELKKHIKKAKNILIISHRGPDPDAFCSMLLLKEAIKQVYPDKVVKVKTKQMPNFNIPTMKDIEVVEHLEKGDEDFIIITDIPSFSMCTIDDKDTLRDTTTPMMIIDHHPEGRETDYNISINESRSSATEQVYITVKKLFGGKLEITKEMAEIAQYGITSDTNRFMYGSTTSDTLRIFAELMDISRVDMENFSYNSQKFPKESIPAIIEFLKNIKIEGDMAYTYIDKNFSVDKTAANEAFRFTKDNIIRYIQGIHWGFLIKPLDKENTWRVSFRSTKGYQLVKDMGEALNGGGHNLAAGGEVEAENIQDAVEETLNIVKKYKN